MQFQIVLRVGLLLVISSLTVSDVESTYGLRWNTECAPIISHRLYSAIKTTGPDKFRFFYEEINPESAKNSTFDRSKSLSIKVIFVGFLSSAEDELTSNLMSAYLRTSEKNLVITTSYIGYVFYLKLFQSKRKLGECTATLVRAIVDENPEIGYKNFHFIGFSIGAHIAAQVSIFLGEKNKVKRITGLDPTCVLFVRCLTKKENMLNKQHADFVDIIHTDIILWGSSVEAGHYDFYVNGGRNQPYHENYDNHLRAMDYFTQTVERKLGYSVHRLGCSIWKWYIGWCKESAGLTEIEFGEYATMPSKEKEGSYIVFTDDRSPTNKAKTQSVFVPWYYHKNLK